MIPNNTHFMKCAENLSLCIRLSIFNLIGLDEKRLCSLTGDSWNMTYLCYNCWCVETRLAPRTGWTLGNKHAVFPCHPGTQETKSNPGWDSMQGVEGTVPRASLRLEDWGKAVCFDFKIHMKWSKEARGLLTTIPGQQLPRCLYQGSWQEIQMLTGLT